MVTLTEILSNNRSQFTSKVIQGVCLILNTKNTLDATLIPETNVQAERFNGMFLISLQSYIEYHTPDDVLYTPELMYE